MCLSLFLLAEMARDSAVGRERVLIVPGSLALDSAPNQHAGASQNELNQQILEVSTLRTSSLIPSSYFYSFCIASKKQYNEMFLIL